MDTTLVTGATGLVGFHVVQALLKRGRHVRVLVRSIDKGQALPPGACELVQGDGTDAAAVRRAMEGGHSPPPCPRGSPVFSMGALSFRCRLRSTRRQSPAGSGRVIAFEPPVLPIPPSPFPLGRCPFAAKGGQVVFGPRPRFLPAPVAGGGGRTSSRGWREPRPADGGSMNSCDRGWGPNVSIGKHIS